MGCVNAKAHEVHAQSQNPSGSKNLPKAASGRGEARDAPPAVLGMDQRSGPAEDPLMKNNGSQALASQMANVNLNGMGAKLGKSNVVSSANDMVSCPPSSLIIPVPSGGYKLRYSYLSQRGYYPDSLNKPNQDAFSVLTEFGGDPSTHFFGVFDGHGEFGTPCAQFARDQVPVNLLEQKQFAKDPVEAHHAAFVLANTQLHRSTVDDTMSGTTAITAMVKGRTLYVSNVGDSRAVLAERRGKTLVAVDLSHDQTPFRGDECARVKLCGARVLTLDQLEGLKNPNIQAWGGEEDDDGDPPRLWVPQGMYPGTAFTRSIGDTVAERIGVIAAPEVLTMELQDKHAFFVIASDGVFEFLSSQAVVDMVAKFEDPHDACEAIVAESYRLWLQYETRTDDITIIIVRIEGLMTDSLAPSPDLSVATRPAAVLVDAGPDPAAPHRNSFVGLQPGSARPVRREASRARKRAIEGISQQSMRRKSLEFIIPPERLPDKTPEEMARLSHALDVNFLFQNMTDAQKQKLCNYMERVEVKPGDLVIRQGDVGDRFYVIDAGEFDVHIAPPGSRAGELGGIVHHYTDKTNPCFGDLALIYNKPREASVRAVTPGVLWALSREAFWWVLEPTASRKALLRTLRAVPPLSALSLVHLQRLANVVVEMTFKEGEVIVSPDEDMTSFYAVNQGSVAIRVTRPSEGDPLSRVGMSDGPSPFLSGSYKAGEPEGAAVGGVMRDGGDGGEAPREVQYFGEWVLRGERGPRLEVVALEDVHCLAIRVEVFEAAVGKLSALEEGQNRLRAAAVRAREKRENDPSIPSDPQLSSLSLADLEWLETVYSTDCSQIGVVKLKSTGQQLTLRRFSRQRLLASGRSGVVRRERALLAALSPSPFVPPVLAATSDAEHLALLLPGRTAAPLAALAGPGNLLPEPVARFYAASTVLALELVHLDNAVYRGVSPDVLLVDESGNLQLADFRFSKQLADGRTYTLCGMADGIAPEAISGEGYGQSVDWWGLGVLIFWLLSGESPFPQWSNDLEVFSRIKRREITFPEHLSPDAADLLDKLLAVDPNERLGCGLGGVDAIRQHPWFAGVDWQGLCAGTVGPPPEALERLAAATLGGGSGGEGRGWLMSPRSGGDDSMQPLSPVAVESPTGVEWGGGGEFEDW